MVSSQRRLQQDYTLRETGVCGQSTPQFDNTPRGERPPHPAEVPNPGLPHKGIGYSATCDACTNQGCSITRSGLEVSGRGLRGFGDPHQQTGNNPTPHHWAGCPLSDGGSMYFSTVPVNSPGSLIDWGVQAAIMGKLGDRAEVFRGMFRLQGPRAATGSPSGKLGQAEGGKIL
ncbi:unnamed protein product [Mytilus edulis]|uniref:Uncharacterized protein n=1 Tax=Mytilus edulis TaxID=6550 RepID=A0A8S3Q1I1_MYTED|nr:unnamed protein product [Mytilus edulis]